jgi:hypothetical protein
MRSLTPASIVVLVSIALGVTASAQESANKKLDSCIRKQQRKDAIGGAIGGAMLGAILAGASDSRDRDCEKALEAKGMSRKDAAKACNKKKDDNSGKVALGMAVAGGAAGLAKAHFTAVANCYQKHPDLVPESRLERSAAYQQVKDEIRYRPEMGLVVAIRSLSAPASFSPGSSVEVNSSVAVMTPDGAEAEVAIERRLYVNESGIEQALPFPGLGAEKRKVEAGEFRDIVRLPMPSNLPVGSVWRLEYVVSAGTRAPSTLSATMKAIAP